MGYFPGDELTEPGPLIPGFHSRVHTPQEWAEAQRRSEEQAARQAPIRAKREKEVAAVLALLKDAQDFPDDEMLLTGRQVSALLRILLDVTASVSNGYTGQQLLYDYLESLEKSA